MNVSSNQWINSFANDFQQRFESLLSYEFRKIDIILSLSVLNPNSKLLANNRTINTFNKNNSNSISNISYSEIKSLLSEWDLKRLDSYQNSLIDYHLILDLIPKFTKMFFSSKLDLQLNYSQCAILLGIGFQKKSLKEISLELNIIEQQTTAMFNKTIRKIYSYLNGIVCEFVQNEEILPAFKNEQKMMANVKDIKPVITETMSDPMISMTSELKQIGMQKKRQERYDRRRLSSKSGKNEILDEYEIRKNALRKKKEIEVLKRMKEYNVPYDLPLPKVNEKVPNFISVEKQRRKISMPEKQIPAYIAPKDFQIKDKAHGINPNSKFHWNWNKKRKYGKKKTRILEEHKILRNVGKTKQKKIREQYFGQ